MWFSFAKFVANLKRNMENQRPLILISNDDGIIAKGISELIKFLRPLGEIVVMAPDAPRSGSASALTVTELSVTSCFARMWADGL